MTSSTGHVTKTILSRHPTKAFQHLDVLRRERRFTDIELIAGERRFPAHRVVLCACSSYFDRMFRPGFQEEDDKEVTLTDFNAETLEILIEFMYTAKITITEENAQDVLAGANLLLLHEVREAASEVLARMLDHNNCLAVKSVASAYSCRELERRAENFLLERFELVCRGDEFMESSLDDVMKILGNDDIIVRSEETVWDTVVNWVQYKKEERRKHFESLLMKTVRFPFLTAAFIRDTILTHDFVKESESTIESVKRELVDVERLHSNKGRDLPAPMYRGSNKLLFLQCGNSSPWLNTQPVLYDFKRRNWSSLPGPLAPMKYREGTSFVFWEGAILSIGGEYNLEPEVGNPPVAGMGMGLGLAALGQIVGAHHELRLDTEVYSLRLEDKDWVQHSSLTVPRKRHQSITSNGKLYVLGGCSVHATPVNSVEILLEGSLEWKEGPSMLSRRVSHGVAEIDGDLWVVGGWDGQAVVKTVERHNRNTGKWEEVQTSWDIRKVGEPVRMKMGVAVLDGKLYTVGGCVQTLDPCYSAHCLDPSTKEWSKLPDMAFSRNNPVLVPYRGRLYVFGGEGNSQGLIERYDPHTGVWEILDSKIKHFANAAYSGTLVDKPWDWDLPGKADDRELLESGPNRHMQRILSGIGLDVVQTMRSHNLY